MDAAGYERQLVQANGNELVLSADENPQCFAIQMANRCHVVKLVVRQVPEGHGGGAPVAFSVDIYNRQICAIDPAGSSESTVPDAVAPELATIFPPTLDKSAGAGEAVQIFSPDGYLFHNQESGFANGSRKMYLKIDAEAPADETRWEVAIGIVSYGPG